MVTVANPDLSVNIDDLKLKNPIITASGTYGYADEYENFVDLQNIGAIITKGITLNPREGNLQPRIKEVKGGLINSIGLENIGIHAFIEKKLPLLQEKNINFILNIAGFSIKEYIELARICEVSNIKAMELNVSCPNVEEGCLEFGKDKDVLYKLVASVREVFSGTIIVKLSSNVSNPCELALKVEKAQANAISAINTVKAMNVNLNIENNKFSHSFIKGGLSGLTIKPIALGFIHEIRQVSNIPIIGMGGISNINDVLEFFAVGSDAVQLGTANFTHPDISEKLAKELENLLIKHNMSNLQDLITEVRKIRDE
ncbi:MAG: dihydroorotate dehydrogenase [bacterium]